MDMMMTRQRIGKLIAELDKLRLSDVRPVEHIEIALAEGSLKDKPSGFKPFENGGGWGGADLHFWFRMTVEIPGELDGKTVVLNITTGREGGWDAINPQFIAFVNGRIVQGMDINHRELILTDSAKAGENYEILLFAYTGSDERKALFACSMAALEKETEALYYDMKTAMEAVDCFKEQDKRRVDIFKFLEDTVALLDFRKSYLHDENFLASVRSARSHLGKVFYEDYCGHEDFAVSGIGHTHIDVAWLWTLSQTREKTVRSFSTVLELMKRYPEYKFTSSQPQLYQFIKEDMPALYGEIKERVKEGRWEAEGAMWLEADCNLTSGESLVRQILFGKRFFKEEFGVENKVLWLPDVFGYSAALPQILKKCGVDYFITTKISWNEYNKAPYDTFLWEGIDGTDVMTHFITATDIGLDYEKKHFTTYNGMVRAETMLGTWGRYQQKDLSDRVLMAYGYGDGGGGPTREMLEFGKRLSKGIPGIPAFRFDSVSEFLEALSKNAKDNGKKLPKWVGELYLEYHRGTYTSMARNKKYNRKSELLLMEVEGLYSALKALRNESYPSEALTEAWRTVLLNQFHDIIPGSSVRKVYEESKVQYEAVLSSVQALKEKASKAIAESIACKTDSLVVFNPTGFDMGNIVESELPDWCRSIRTEEGNLLPVERTAEGTAMVYVQKVPAKGYKAFEISADEAHSANSITIREDYLENRYYAIKLDQQGLITSIYDKVNDREVIKSGEKANKLTAFEDMPHNWDAWDINIYYQQKQWDITDVESITVTEKGSVRGTLEIRRRFLDSSIVQKIQIYGDSPRIDFNTHIDWKERHILLKAAFPVDIHTDRATYDIQFGNVERPTHWNTSWDVARFEVCGHKWADLSENGYGVSLLNDCKYGHDIKDGTIRLTLLKSSTHPNEDADREAHDFVYSLLPHADDFRNSTILHAYALNMPFTGVYTQASQGTFAPSFSFVSHDKDHIVVETVKQAEKGDDTVLRIYEAHNRRGTDTLRMPLPVKAAWECTMLEENTKALECNGNEIKINVLPFEIKTIKVSF